MARNGLKSTLRRRSGPFPLAGRKRRVNTASLCPMARWQLSKGFSKGGSGALVFPSPRGARPLSHVAMSNVMRRMKIEGATVHGFRSAFRDWVGNETHLPRELAEA